MPDDEFIFVKSRRKNNKRKTLQLRGTISSNTCCVATKESVLGKLESAKQEIQISDFFSLLFELLLQTLNSKSDASVEQIICYGLGNFSENVTSRYQLALLLLLKHGLHTHVFIHDPLFNGVECDLLEQLGCKVIKQNEEGKRTIKIGTKTLAYFPHCPKQLINNFLWSNWNINLENCVIIGNSFSTIIETNTHKHLTQNAAYVQLIFPFVKEMSVVNSFRYNDIFNDLSVHAFPDLKGPSALSLWSSCEEPKYSKDDVELIMQEIIPALKHSNLQ
ncbi:hypothetical protein R5R35_007815 [Gryllus longicercus]